MQKDRKSGQEKTEKPGVEPKDKYAFQVEEVEERIAPHRTPGPFWR